MNFFFNNNNYFYITLNVLKAYKKISKELMIRINYIKSYRYDANIYKTNYYYNNKI